MCGMCQIMARPEEFPIKFQLAVSQEMEELINDWRRSQKDLPNRSEAIRRLIEVALRRIKPRVSTE